MIVYRQGTGAINAEERRPSVSNIALATAVPLLLRKLSSKEEIK